MSGNRLFTYEEFSEQYTSITTHFVEYYGIISAIPEHWKISTGNCKNWWNEKFYCRNVEK